MNEPPRGQRRAGEDEIRQTEHRLGSYSSHEYDTRRGGWQHPRRRPAPLFNITHVRFAGGGEHQHISELRWQTTTNQTGVDALTNMIDRIRNGADVLVTTQTRVVRVGVVDADPPYIRAYEERYTAVTGLPRYLARLGGRSFKVQPVWTDDLLTLPRF
jgi:hypothetical protein